MGAPPPPLLLRCSEVVNPIYAAVSNSRADGRTLETARDTLLPRLLSGELSVRNAERFVESRA